MSATPITPTVVRFKGHVPGRSVVTKVPSSAADPPDSAWPIRRGLGDPRDPPGEVAASEVEIEHVGLGAVQVVNELVEVAGSRADQSRRW
ncbi:MAG: hypothetical protein ACXV5Q_17680 [Frankiaceae bacterium]